MNNTEMQRLYALMDREDAIEWVAEELREGSGTFVERATAIVDHLFGQEAGQ